MVNIFFSVLSVFLSKTVCEIENVICSRPIATSCQRHVTSLETIMILPLVSSVNIIDCFFVFSALCKVVFLAVDFRQIFRAVFCALATHTNIIAVTSFLFCRTVVHGTTCIAAYLLTFDLYIH